MRTTASSEQSPMQSERQASGETCEPASDCIVSRDTATHSHSVSASGTSSRAGSASRSQSLLRSTSLDTTELSDRREAETISTADASITTGPSPQSASTGAARPATSHLSMTSHHPRLSRDPVEPLQATRTPTPIVTTPPTLRESILEKKWLVVLAGLSLLGTAVGTSFSITAKKDKSDAIIGAVLSSAFPGLLSFGACAAMIGYHHHANLAAFRQATNR